MDWSNFSGISPRSRHSWEENATKALSKRSKRRLSEALGSDESTRTKIRKTFGDLYDFRSELVHGRRPSKNVVLERHLFEARELARGLLRWFTRLIWDVQIHIDAGGSSVEPPTRRDILRLLDLEGDGLRKARWLLPMLPDSFPRYPDLSA